MAVAPPTKPPRFSDELEPENRVDAMIEWFHENFEDPAEGLPYESREGGYQWLWGGPYEAEEELQRAFPEVSEDEIASAVEQLEANGVYQWSPNTRRVEEDFEPYDRVGDAEYDGSLRSLPPQYDPHRYTLVETTLLPQRKFDWSIHVTFVPVKTNQTLSNVVELATGRQDDSSNYGRDDYTFHSLRDLVGVLVSDRLVGAVVGTRPDIEEAYEWLQSLKTDKEVFVDDAVIVHASPPAWQPLSEMFKHGSVSAVALISNSPGHWSGVLLMYGGSLMFLRLVKNLNFVQDAFFERWAKRIKKGDNDPF